MHSAKRFFATVPTKTSADDIDTTDKLDLLLTEFHDQKQCLKFVQEQCDQVLSFADTIVRYCILFCSTPEYFYYYRSVEEVKESVSALDVRINKLETINSVPSNSKSIKCPKELSVSLLPGTRKKPYCKLN